MNPNQGREAAYVKSRVKDLSLITNAPDYVALFACITPKASSELENEENITYLDANGNATDDRSETNKVYLPQLVRDVETLDTLFGDPRVDPETYKDLLAVRYIVQNGFACYIAKVKSGRPYRCSVSTGGFFNSRFSGKCQYNPQLDDLSQLKSDLENCLIFNTQSSIIGTNKLTLRLIPYKPYNINQVSLEIVFTNKATDLSEEVTICSTRVTLTPDTKNATLLKTINSYLGGDLIFQLPNVMDDSLYATPYDAYAEKDGYQCIVNTLLYMAGVYELSKNRDSDYLVMDNMVLTGSEDVNPKGIGLNNEGVKERWLIYYQNSNGEETFGCATEKLDTSKLDVDQSNYTRSLQTFNDPKYSGCFISELSSDITNKENVYKARYLVKPSLYAYAVPEGGSEEPFPTEDNPFRENGDCCANQNENIFVEVEHSPQDESSSATYTYEEVKGLYKALYSIQNESDDPENPDLQQKINKDTALFNLDNVYKVTPRANSWAEQGFTTDWDPSCVVSKVTEADVEYDAENDAYTWKDDNDDFFFFMKKNPSLSDDKLTPVSNTVYTDTDGNVVQLETPLHRKCYPNITNDDASSLSNFTATQSQTVSPFYVEGEVDGKTQFVLGIDEKTAEATGAEENDTDELNVLREMTQEQRRGLHYIIKQLAAVRKNLTCVFATPYCPLVENNDGELVNKDDNIYDLNKACNWVAARGDFADLFEYGNSQAVEYSEQAFYCEMYWSWLKWRVTKLVNGLATGSTTVIVPPSAFVILNALASYRAKGAFYPVAGDQGGILPDSCVALQNPSTKTQRDKLISYRINPIFDTGTRGVQIYGNETLNPQFTDLSAAHIARTLVQIRSQVDAYSETIKFSLNDMFTWGTWISYVSSRILDPIKSLGGLQWYQVQMGYNTTTREEISQRKIRGMISLQFTPDLEIIDLEFIVMASSLELATE